MNIWKQCIDVKPSVHEDKTQLKFVVPKEITDSDETTTEYIAQLISVLRSEFPKQRIFEIGRTRNARGEIIITLELRGGK